MRALFLGDSHLAHLQPHHLSRLERELAAEIETVAFGGAWSGDLQQQVGGRDLRSFDVVLLSIGTNDTHPTCNSSPEVLRGNVARVLTDAKHAALLLSPGVARAPAPFDTNEVNAKIQAFTDVVARMMTEYGGRLVPTSWVLEELGHEAWSPDGLHLSSESYDSLVPSLANALRDPHVPH